MKAMNSSRFSVHHCALGIRSRSGSAIKNAAAAWLARREQILNVGESSGRKGTKKIESAGRVAKKSNG
ncbi:MAG: hypothetical protein Q8O34_08635 [Rhodocyclaceae bacterium]|nr:hypothetical protein [Rhodocyclaceae bacterium]